MFRRHEIQKPYQSENLTRISCFIHGAPDAIPRKFLDIKKRINLDLREVCDKEGGLR